MSFRGAKRREIFSQRKRFLSRPLSHSFGAGSFEKTRGGPVLSQTLEGGSFEKTNHASNGYKIISPHGSTCDTPCQEYVSVASSCVTQHIRKKMLHPIGHFFWQSLYVVRSVSALQEFSSFSLPKHLKPLASLHKSTSFIDYWGKSYGRI